MAEKQKLKPCPFCGGKGRLCSISISCGLSPFHWIVICEKCECRTTINVSDHDAVNAWNRRMKKTR